MYMSLITSEITKLKIKRNLCIVELLEVENKVVKVEMVQKYRLLKYNTEYIVNLKKVIAFEVQQLADYKVSREYDIKWIVDGLNNNDLQLDDLQKDLRKLKDECKCIMEKLNNINDIVPLFGYIATHKKN